MLKLVRCLCSYAHRILGFMAHVILLACLPALSPPLYSGIRNYEQEFLLCQLQSSRSNASCRPPHF